MSRFDRVQAVVQALAVVPPEKVRELGITITKMGVPEIEDFGWALRELGENDEQRHPFDLRWVERFTT